MKIYVFLACMLLLLLQNLAKCSENEGASNSFVSKSEEAMSTGKKKRKYLDYFNVRGHSRKMDREFEALLIKKEYILKIKTVYKWEDMYKYPLKEHSKYWNNFCGIIWPGVPEDILKEKIDPTQIYCVAELFAMDGDDIGNVLYYKGFRHDYDPEKHKNAMTFTGDFLCCDCKYVRSGKKKWAVPGSRTYFFAMKIDEREYFLLTKFDKEEVNPELKRRPRSSLKIVDYVHLLESKDINLNS